MAVTVNVPKSPAVNVVDTWLVSVGAWFTTREKGGVTVPWLLLAVMVRT